ncbi:MAG: methyltransferase domain-containing protein [Candidatus Parcubacteria bacterium]|nr:methyltransferase domain-containing protein [Candidatus Parcubacteria bacterium]
MKKDFAEYLLKKTVENYNLIADDFSRTRKEAWPEIKFLFESHIIPGDKVLDLGCGNGRQYQFIMETEGEYFGVDNSEKLIEICKKKYPEGKFQTANALNLPYPDNYFDKVYSIAVLHHMPSDEFRFRFLQEANRVLKPGGLLIMTVWKFYQFSDLMKIFKNNIIRLFGFSKLDFNDIFEPWGKKTERYYHFFPKKELINLTERVGFKIKDVGLTKNKRGNRQNTYIIAEK